MTISTISGFVGHGIKLNAGNYGHTLTVSKTGKIAGSKYGVFAGLSGSSVLNAGSIEGSTYGVYLNQATLYNTGVVSGGKAAVFVNFYSNLDNSGSIRGTGDGIAVNIFGTVNNTGDIYGATTGAYVFGGRVVNSNTISGGREGGFVESGVLTNDASGMISGAIGVVVAPDVTALRPGDVPPDFVNFGTVSGSVAGVYVSDSTYAAAGGGGSSVTENAIFYNKGIVDGSPVGVLMESGQLGNLGIIEGQNFGVSLQSGNVINSGTISGLSYAVYGDNQISLTVYAGAVFDGKVKDRSGNGRVDLTGIGPATLSGIGTSITGFSYFFIQNPSWALEGNVAGLTSGQQFNGMPEGGIILTGFSATYVRYSYESGITISNGEASETFNVGPYRYDSVFADNGNSYLKSLPTTSVYTRIPGSISVISAASGLEVAPGEGEMALGVTIASMVRVSTSTAPAVYAANHVAGAFALNNGLLINTGQGSAVEFRESGTLINNGSITSSGNYDGSGRRSAVNMQGGGSFTNTGFVNGGVFGETLDVSNQGAIRATDAGGIGVDLRVGNLANSGQILGDYIGVRILNPVGGVNVNNSGNISGTRYGVGLNGAVVLTNSGTISGGTDAIHTAHNEFSLYVEPGAAFVGDVLDGYGDGKLTLAGTAPASLNMGATFIGFSSINFDTNAKWTLEGTASDIATHQNIDGQNINRSITGFAPGDTLMLDGLTVTSYRFVAGTGLVLDSSTGATTLDIVGEFTTSDFKAINNAKGVAITTEAAPCFCRGTRIATAKGNVSVETLKIGDLLQTRDNGLMPVRWIGRRAYNGRFIAGNHLALPVKFRRHALGFNVPSRDLKISPGHAICEGGVLVHSWLFINGLSVTQAQQVECVEYFHIELDRHSIIFAENMPVESFLDNGSRAQFENAADAPELAPQLPCLPRVEDGYYLEKLKSRINARAGILPASGLIGPLRGCIDQAGPRLCGWAQNAAAPESPVELELLCNGEVVCRFLANLYRADLRDAGIGSGSHGFDFVMPQPAGQIAVRRVSDGTNLATANIKAA